MASMSFSLLLALNLLYASVFCIPQEALAPVTEAPEFLQSGPAPDLAQQASANAPSCGGCYLVADVAGLVWYSQVFINTAATALVSVGVGNGTSATRTSILQNEGDFTFNPSATEAAGALTQLNFQPTVNVGGAILTSPTAYNVFTAYSITSAFPSNGVCITTSGAPTTLSSAYTETLASANGRVTLDANGQQEFINFLGFSSCSGGGENVVPTALIQVTNTTATQTATFSNVPLAAAQASLSIAPQSISASATLNSSIAFPSANAPVIVVGNSTITPTANPINLPIFNGSIIGTATNLGGQPTGLIILPTGGSGPSVIPFVGAAPQVTRGDAWLVSLWATAMAVLGGVVYYL
ncbi:hypothetical protein MMC21_002517 [Puttea exsequens]|nr:hypothetical protein [Puttea exsequens]